MTTFKQLKEADQIAVNSGDLTEYLEAKKNYQPEPDWGSFFYYEQQDDRRCDWCGEEFYFNQRVFECGCGNIICQACVESDDEKDGWPKMCPTCYRQRTE